jgi:hypothetical protein
MKKKFSPNGGGMTPAPPALSCRGRGSRAGRAGRRIALVGAERFAVERGDLSGSAIFVVEDDSQAGSDHVDGHRAPVQIISPYAKHGVVDNTYYTQISMIRTIEQILGIHPMNDKDSKIYAPNQVPGATLPSSDSE